MNKLLTRQITKHWGAPENVPADLRNFLDVISQTYDHHDRDRSMLERSIELSSSEMIELNERLRAESRELSKAHEELSTLFRNIDTVFFTVDMIQHKLIQMSPTCEKIYGYTAQDFLENSNLWFEVVLDEDKHIIENHYPTMHAGIKFSHINRIRANDGTIRWVETKITPSLNEAKELIRIDGITTDVTTKIISDEQSRQQEIRFRKLIEKSHDGISLLGADGRLQYNSPSVERILGYTVDELLNADPTNFIHPDDKEWVVQLLTETMSHRGTSKRANYRLKNKSGEWRWISSSITNLLHEKSVNALVFNYEDITDHTEAVKQIEFDRRNRDALINSTHDLMWSFDSDIRLVTANKAFLTAMKQVNGIDIVPGDNLLSESGFTLQTLVKWKALYSRVLSGESFVYENYEAAPFDQWAELSFNPITENGKVIGGSCSWHDITEKKRQSEQLIASERMMAEAQRISRFGSWELRFDSQEEIIPESITWSNEVYRIYGCDPDTYVPNLEDNKKRILPQDWSLVEQWSISVLQRESPGSIDYRIYGADMQIRWIKTSSDLICDSQTGKRIKLVGTIQDITERKSLEHERLTITKDLVQRNKALEQFAHIVSHNLRSPVANIMGLTHLLRLPQQDNHTQEQCISGLAISAMRLDDIIKDLNKILQVKRGMIEDKTVVSFETLVHNIMDSIQMQIAQAEVTINTDFSEVAEMYTIKNYMHSVFYNLISNSIKYRRPKVNPVIEISSRTEAGKTILRFRDNCLGIDMEKHGENVFGLYKRFHHDVEGKGLGMFMVKTQVESLGGKVAINSKVNEGTEITIEFADAS